MEHGARIYTFLILGARAIAREVEWRGRIKWSVIGIANMASWRML